MLCKSEVFSRKVFIGGLPIDIKETELKQTFHKFGSLLVDWPNRSSDSHFVKKEHYGATSRVTGYAFLIFLEEASVQRLIAKCYSEGDRYYMLMSSQTVREKPVQVRPWRLTDMDHMPRPTAHLDPRRTIFIGGVPRPTKASELAFVLESVFGPVCYAGIDVDPEMKYPKGAARVTFNTFKSYAAAMAGRFVQIPHSDNTKRVEIKPYVVNDQMCDNCQGKLCQDRYAPYFCGDVTCLQYYCEICWDRLHYGSGNRAREAHKPFVRMGEQTKQLFRLPHHHHANSNPVANNPPHFL
uniref:Cytoplasmic polyadenylation element-binding protein 1 n=1 Tax=Globodera rostochiensis TaxID=31243 RepID=A0A914HGK5_GLORO